MARVTAGEVKDIIETDLSDTRIDSFITASNAVVNKVLVGKKVGDDLLKEIERWLAAHYIAATIERQSIHEKGGPAEQRFSDVFGKYLEMTTYGQTAISLDPSGELENLTKRNIVIKAIPQ